MYNNPTEVSNFLTLVNPLDWSVWAALLPTGAAIFVALVLLMARLKALAQLCMGTRRTQQDDCIYHAASISASTLMHKALPASWFRRMTSGHVNAGKVW